MAVPQQGHPAVCVLVRWPFSEMKVVGCWIIRAKRPEGRGRRRVKGG